ncbi:MAG TPA: LysR substrate-binding domain-containing protein [Acidimicrobiia bacterium]|nr:LysR substrate-binding domain-containing protein [Acidimicrobiia bacterium]
MELRRLEMFLAVVDHGTFTAAARAVHVSQPGLSKAIAELERELGTPLFDRIGRSVRLTAAGRALVEPARLVARDVESGVSAVSAVAGLEAGSISLACLPTLAADPTAGLVGAFRSAHPGIRVELAAPDDPRHLLAMLRGGDVELAIGDEPPDRRGLTTHQLGDQDLVAVLPPGAEVGTRPMSLGELATHALVVGTQGSSTRRLLDEALAQTGVEPTIAVETAQREAVLPLVLAGAGVALLPRPIAALAERLGAVVRPTRPVVSRSVVLAHRAVTLSPAARAFCSLADAGLSGTTSTDSSS